MGDAGTLENREKLQIALAAAMGGGCRTCAEKLFALAKPAGATPDELERACLAGLEARGEATARMREKAEALLGRSLAGKAAGRPRERDAVAELCLLAASVAANSAPEALRHGHGARARGATGGAIAATIGIGERVRSKAQGFSDAEIRDARGRAGGAEACEASREEPAGGAPRKAEAGGCGCTAAP